MAFVEPRDLGPKPWGEELLLAETPLYTLKKLTYEAGRQGAFQYHEYKDESFHLAEGEAEVTWTDELGIHSSDMLPGQTFHVPPGTPHKFHAISRCVVYEASNPIFDDRVVVDDVYDLVSGQRDTEEIERLHEDRQAR